MGETTTITTADGPFSAYVARPAGAPRGGLVIIQEIFGVNAVMRDIADRYAKEGYIAVCPDLFWRIEPGVDITDKTQAEWDKAFSLYGKFDVDTGVDDIQATITHMRAHFGAEKIGAVGFCLGGLLAFLTGTRTDADAAVGYYGVGIEGMVGEAEKLTAPLMLHIATKDQFVPPPAQTVIHEALDAHRLITIHDYAGQDHAFAREGGEHYDKASADLANERTLAFFRAHVG